MKRVVLLILVLVIFALLLITIKIPSIHEHDERSNTTAETVLQAAHCPPLRWSHILPSYYDIAISNSMMLENAEDDPNSLNTLFKGTLVLSVAKRYGNAMDIHAAFPDAWFEINTRLNPETSAQLSSGFQIMVAANGEFKDFHFPVDLDGQVVAMLEEIIRTFEVIVNQGTNKWKTNETCRSGTFSADYRFVSPATVEKTNKLFLAGPAGGDRSMVVEVLNYNAMIVLSEKNNWIDSFHSEEKIKVIHAGTTILQSTMTATLTRTNTIPMAKWVHSAKTRENSNVRNNEINTLGGTDSRETFTKMIDEFKRLDPNNISKIHKLVAFLKDHGEHCEDLAAQLLIGEFGDIDMSQLFLVLELTGSAQAQAALVQLMQESSLTEGNRLRAIIAMGGVGNPTEETLNALWKNFDDRSAGNENLSNTAALALGTISHNVKGDDDDLWETTSNQIADRFYTETDPAARSILLMALSNTDTELHYQTFTSALSDEEADVRIAAAHSLGKSMQKGTAKILMERFSAEEDPNARKSIAAALAHNTEPDAITLTSAISLIFRESDESTRWGLARYIARQSHIDQGNNDLLINYLPSEPSQRIRNVITGRLVTTP